MAGFCPDARIGPRLQRAIACAGLLLVVLATTEAEAADPAPVLPPKLAHVRFGGGDGRSCDTAVVVLNARNTGEGVAAEKVWLRAAHPQARVTEQALVRGQQAVYDRFTLADQNGTAQTVCFDITGFFGTW